METHFKIRRKVKINFSSLVRIVHTYLHTLLLMLGIKNSDPKLTLLYQIRIVMITDYILFRIKIVKKTNTHDTYLLNCYKSQAILLKCITWKLSIDYEVNHIICSLRTSLYQCDRTTKG